MNECYRHSIPSNESELLKSPQMTNDYLYQQSKYFNNLSKSNPKDNKSRSNLTENPTTVTSDPKKFSLESTKVHSNFQNLNKNLNSAPSNTLLKNANNIDFINTLMRLKSGLKSENSVYTNINQKNDDESKSYIKEILDICSAGECKNIENSNYENFEIKNFNLDDNSSINSNNVNNNSFINNANNIQSKCNNIKLIQKSEVTLVNQKNSIQQPKSLKVDDLIEITNKRKSMLTNNLSSNDAYLRRRHLESISKLEKLKKEKDQREIFDHKFTPNINRKSREIIENMKHQSHKSEERIKDFYNPFNENFTSDNRKDNNYFKTDRKNRPSKSNNPFCNEDFINQIDNIIKEEKISKRTSFLNNLPVDESQKLKLYDHNLYIDVNNEVYLPFKTEQNLDTPNYKNLIIRTEELVNYGTKNNDLIIPGNYRVTSPNNQIYETNQNFMFSYESNQLEKEIKDINTKIEAKLTSNIIPPKIAKSTRKEIDDKSPFKPIDHVEINLFDNSNLNIINSKENEEMNTKSSYPELFPVTEKSDYKLEENNFKTNNLNNSNHINTLTMNTYNSVNNDKDRNYNINYNQFNSRLDSLGNDTSELSEFNCYLNLKQNESANLNMFIDSRNQNSKTQLNKISSKDEVSLNFSKFTNFVGMSEQYSKKSFNNKIINNNYYNNILSKKEKENNNQSNDLSNRNLINSYMSNEIGTARALNKNPSGKTIGNNSVYVPIIAEINLSDDETVKNLGKFEMKKLNYFDIDKDLRISSNVIYNTARDKLQIPLTGLNNFSIIQEKRNEQDIEMDDSRLKVFPRLNYEKPKSNPFTSSKKASSKMNNKVNDSEREKSGIEKNYNRSIVSTLNNEIKNTLASKPIDPNKKSTLLHNKGIKNKKRNKHQDIISKFNKIYKRDYIHKSSSPNKNTKIKKGEQNFIKILSPVNNKKEILSPVKTNKISSSTNVVEIKGKFNRTDDNLEKIQQNKSIFIIQKQISIENLTEENKAKSINQIIPPYDYSKFSLDIVNTNSSNKSKNDQPTSNYMNEIVTNTIQKHRIYLNKL